MSGVFHGHAFIHGVAANSSTVSIGGYAAVFIDSVPVQHSATFTEHIGADGKTGALQWENEYLELSLTFRPAASTTVADADAKAILIPKGATVTLSGFRPVKLNNADILNGDWINTGDATLTLNASGAGEVSLVVRNYLDKQTALKTAVPAA